MLQTNLIFGIQKKIKDGFNKAKSDAYPGMLEESTDASLKEEATELILESNFMAEMHTRSLAAKKKKEVKGRLITESFQMHKAKKKLEKDIEYFNYLNENFVDDVFKDQYKLLVESVLNDTIKLYRECDVTPRLISPSLDSQELNENQIIDIYKNNLNKTISDKYTKPLLSGQISEIYENEIRELTKKLITEGSSLDMEHVRIFMPFEETLYQFNKSILVPSIAESRIESFIESTSEEYNEFIEESAEDLLQSIEKKMKLLTSMISPNMFDASVEAEGVDAPKMAGITIAVDKNFDDDGDELEGCPNSALDDEAAVEVSDDEAAEALDDDIDDIDDVDDGKSTVDLPLSDEEETMADEFSAEDEDSQRLKLDKDQEVLEISADEASAPTSADSTDNFSNDADVELQGKGKDYGEDDAAGATLPGSVPAEGELESDSDVGNEPASQESVDSEGQETELEPNGEDISDTKEDKSDSKPEDPSSEEEFMDEVIEELKDEDEAVAEEEAEKELSA